MKTTYYVEKMPYFSLNPSHKHPNHQFPLYLHLDNILPVAPYYIKQQTKQRSFVQTTFLLVFLCCVILFSFSFTSLFFAHSKKKNNETKKCVCVCVHIFFLIPDMKYPSLVNQSQSCTWTMTLWLLINQHQFQ